MAASFTIAARNNAFNRSDARAATVASVAYRARMAAFAEMRTLDVWYAASRNKSSWAGSRTHATWSEPGKQAGKARRRPPRRGTKGAHPGQLAGSV